MVKNRLMLDFERDKRTNLPEVIFGKGKDKDALLQSIRQIYSKTGRVLVTKCTRTQLNQIRNYFKDMTTNIYSRAGCAIIGEKLKKCAGTILVIAAGTSDYGIAEEASVSAEFFGLNVFKCYDCGVAGIHRLNAALNILKHKKIDVIIVVAGMEGALPSVVAGLVKQPVIAVPTSIGYGSNFKGISALLTMLNTCSPGITVVNIDNGFGAAAAAYKMVKWLKPFPDRKKSV
jgi:hypothetical protein